MRYVPNVSVATWNGESVRETYREALEVAWSRDARFRNTGVGPHRDELLLSLTGGSHPTEVREFGSGGQRRTAALALRLVEGDCIRSTRGTDPILLLDDAFAELDDGASRTCPSTHGRRTFRPGDPNGAQGQRRAPEGRRTPPLGYT